MKFAIAIYALIILTFALIAGYLAINGKDGWGWFLFASLLCAAGFTYSEKSND
jgi:hypothetical protein